MALPQLGWPYERLLKKIWLPLTPLRGHRCRDIERDNYHTLKVIDSTGVFEQTDKMSDEEEESEQERNTESDRDSDIEENESDESRSEDSGSGGHPSNDDEAEEDDMKVFAPLQLVAMRLTAARMSAMNMGIMKIEATKPQATSTAAMIQEERPPMAQLPTQAVTELQMPQLSSKTTVKIRFPASSQPPVGTTT